jgi:hypothetical protein
LKRIFRSTVGRGLPPEVPGEDLEAHTAAQAQKNPQVLAEQLLLVLNGTLSTAAVLGAEGPARQGLALARQLVAAACS